MKKMIPQKIKNIYHLIQALLANVFYGFPSKNIQVIGVTGTNGKTTTCQMVSAILEEAGKRVSMASTINFKIGDKTWVNKTKYTTLSPWSVQKFLREAVDSGCNVCVLETSSHSLDQFRVWGVQYDVAVMTNITREHLDYHKTMGKYRKAKLRLFRDAQIVIINGDMEDPNEFLQYSNKVKLIYSLKKQDADIFATQVEMGLHESRFQIRNTHFKLSLPGGFNIENALAAVSVGISQKISLEAMANALERIDGVSGRLEDIKNKHGINVIVDYAVTPDSLEQLYIYLVSTKKENTKIIAVFGSCGERDRGKRPIMGEIVSRYADKIIITNEDPYGEDPVQIINEVFSGVVGRDVVGKIPNFQFPTCLPPACPVGKNSNYQTNLNDKFSKLKTEGIDCWRVFDRREAIGVALKLAEKDDIVIVTGKGAEETMAIGKKRIPWNDKKVILEEIEKM